MERTFTDRMRKELEAACELAIGMPPVQDEISNVHQKGTTGRRRS